MEGLEGMTYIKHPKRGVKELWNFRIEIPRQSRLPPACAKGLYQNLRVTDERT